MKLYLTRYEDSGKAEYPLISWQTLMRDWVTENFPQYQVGEEFGTVGLFLPTNTGYKSARWVASFRRDGVKIRGWCGGRTPEGSLQIRHEGHFRLDDPKFFESLKLFVIDAAPATVELWLWPEIK